MEIIETIITEAADAHCPIKHVKINEDTPNWFNREILSEIHNKGRLYKKAKKTGNQEDWDIFKRRPISQICLPGKLLERIIHSQLSHYIETNKILSGNQYGFRKGLSTSLAIFDVLKVLYENWNNKLFSGCVFRLLPCFRQHRPYYTH